MLITGDSSGLSAIDPVHLEKQFNKKFQVLSTMGVVGPLGHIKLIDNYLNVKCYLNIEPHLHQLSSKYAKQQQSYMESNY